MQRPCGDSMCGILEEEQGDQGLEQRGRGGSGGERVTGVGQGWIPGSPLLGVKWTPEIVEDGFELE